MTRAASASSKCSLCCTTLGEALWERTQGTVQTDTMLLVMPLSRKRLTDRVLVIPISREIAALNRKSSVKWLVTWENRRKNRKINNKVTERLRPRWASPGGSAVFLAAAVVTNHLVDPQTAQQHSAAFSLLIGRERERWKGIDDRSITGLLLRDYQSATPALEFDV